MNDEKIDVAQLPEPVAKVMREQVGALRRVAPETAQVTATFHRSRFGTYRASIIVRPDAGAEPTHGLRVSCSYDGKDLRRYPLVRVPGAWLGT